MSAIKKIMFLCLVLFSSIGAFSQVAVVDTIYLSGRPKDIGINPLTNKIYVSNGAGTVSIIDASSNLVIDSVEVHMNPNGIGVNSATNRVYVTNYNI